MRKGIGYSVLMRLKLPLDNWDPISLSSCCRWYTGTLDVPDMGGEEAGVFLYPFAIIIGCSLWAVAPCLPDAQIKSVQAASESPRWNIYSFVQEEDFFLRFLSVRKTQVGSISNMNMLLCFIISLCSCDD